MLYLLALLLAACSGSASVERPLEEPVEVPGRDAFMGLDDKPLEADWESWTPASELAAPTMDAFLAFDVWTVDSAQLQERLWVSLFTMVDLARSYLPAESSATTRELMTVLEPGGEDGPVTDVVFIVGEDARSEGVLVRHYRSLPNGGTPGVMLELRRVSGRSDAPTVVRVHLHSGYKESPSYRVDLGQPDKLRWAQADASSWNEDVSESVTTELTVVRSMILETFWQDVIANAYVEPTWEISREVPGYPVDFAAGHGQPVDLRPIEHVLSDTVFPPRLELSPPSKSD